MKFDSAIRRMKSVIAYSSALQKVALFGNRLFLAEFREIRADASLLPISAITVYSTSIIIVSTDSTELIKLTAETRIMSLEKQPKSKSS